MHIMLIANDTTFVYNLRREILIELKKLGHKVTVAGQVFSFQEQYKELGIDVIDLVTERRGTNPLSDLKLFKLYYGMLKETKPDVVFTNNIKPNVYAGLACKKLKIIYIPNITGLGTAVEIPGKLQKLTTFLYKLGVSGAHTLFFQNSENLKFFQDRNMIKSTTKVILLPGSGVNLETHPAMPFPQDGMNDGKIHFLFVARIMKEKGIDVFLETAKHFRELRQDVVFDICGMCDDKKYLEILEEYQKNGFVEYHGLQKDINPFYEKCSCFLYPSYYPEGMSNVLLEAAACARPVIAADRAGCRETVDDKVSGYVVPVNDTAATIKAVESFLSLTREEREEMGRNGRSKMEREFDRKLVVEQYLNEIKTLSV